MLYPRADPIRSSGIVFGIQLFRRQQCGVRCMNVYCLRIRIPAQNQNKNPELNPSDSNQEKKDSKLKVQNESEMIRVMP